jgi:hypothetical protein
MLGWLILKRDLQNHAQEHSPQGLQSTRYAHRIRDTKLFRSYSRHTNATQQTWNNCTQIIHKTNLRQVTAAKDSSNDPYNESYTIEELFGKRSNDDDSTPLQQIISRQLAEKVTASRKAGPIPILFSIALAKSFETKLQNDFQTTKQFVKLVTDILLKEILTFDPIRPQEQMVF